LREEGVHISDIGTKFGKQMLAPAWS